MIQYQLTKKKDEPTTFDLTLTAYRFIFMGTPEFAVTSLDALLNAGLNIVAVITAPDKPAGRGMKLNESPVKKYAREKGLKILQPVKLKDPAFLDELRSLKADLQVVVAFRMLPEIVWNMPAIGTINLHGSLLPQYRGAAPINWAVINGEKETGVTTFKLKQAIDTGDTLLQESFPIDENETAGELHDRMKEIGAKLLVRTVQGILNGELKERPQTALSDGDRQTTWSDGDRQTMLKQAPKIVTETGKIDWNMPVDKIHNLVRGLSPLPGAFTFLDGKMLKVYKSKKEIIIPLTKPGEYETDHKTFLKFASPDGYIHLIEVQLEGKKKMNISAFLQGYRFA